MSHPSSKTEAATDALEIAGEICVFTNDQLKVLVLGEEGPAGS